MGREVVTLGFRIRSTGFFSDDNVGNCTVVYEYNSIFFIFNSLCFVYFTERISVVKIIITRFNLSL